MGDSGAGELVNIDTGELISEFVNEAVPKPPGPARPALHANLFIWKTYSRQTKYG